MLRRWVKASGAFLCGRLLLDAAFMELSRFVPIRFVEPAVLPHQLASYWVWLVVTVATLRTTGRWLGVPPATGRGDWRAAGLVFALLVFFFEANLMVMLAISPSFPVESVEELPWLAALVAPAAAVVEELVYRGLLLGLWARCSRGWGVLVSSLAFGLAHVEVYGIANGLLIALPGVAYAWVALRSGRLREAMLVHWLYDAVVFGELWLAHTHRASAQVLGVVLAFATAVVVWRLRGTLVAFMREAREWGRQVLRSSQWAGVGWLSLVTVTVSDVVVVHGSRRIELLVAALAAVAAWWPASVVSRREEQRVA